MRLGYQFATHTLYSLLLQSIPGLEHPPHDEQAGDQEHQNHGQTQSYAHVGDFEKAPAKTADQVNHRVEQGDGLPGRRQHAD